MSRRVGRPSTPQLDRESIGAAALELVDNEGGFTMPALARRLDVQASSLYHHVNGRGDVVELVRAQVTRDVSGAGFDLLSWDEALTAVARDYRSAFAAHPAAVRLLATETITAQSSVAIYQSAAASLLRAGFSDHLVLAVIVAVDDFVLGAALDVSAPDVIIEIDPDDPVAEPLRRALAAAPSGPERSLQAFELGLAALIEGLRALLIAEPQRQ